MVRRWLGTTGTLVGSTSSSTWSARRNEVASTKSPTSWWFRRPPQWPIINIVSGRSTATWSVIVLAFDGPTPMLTRLTPSPAGVGWCHAGIWTSGRDGPSASGNRSRNASTWMA